MSVLEDIATRHQVHLERLKAAEVRDYNTLLAILAAQVDDVLRTLLVERLSDLKRARLNAILRELRAAQDAALDEANDRLLRRLETLAEYEAGFEARALTDAARDIDGTEFTAATGVWATVAARPLSAAGALLEPFLREMTKREVEMVNKVVLRGFTEGWTTAQVTKVLRGTKALKYTDGLMTRLGRHNATLVRTAMQHVSTTAREATWADNDVKKYRWVSTLDSRTTPICRDRDGDEFPVGRGPLPPAHMNCRSSTIAVLTGPLAQLSRGRTRASASGPVPASMTYYEWLKTQDADFQDEALGPTRGKLFRDGGLSVERFSALQLGSSFKPLTLEEMRKLEPSAFRRAGLDR